MNERITVEFILDGKHVKITTEPAKRLLDLLREDQGVTGVKEGCGEGECGACSVLKDGLLVNSCSIPAIAVHGSEILTIEGFSKTPEYDIIADCFAEAGAVQCGFCTPGFIMAAAALLNETPNPSEEDIRIGLSGNLCRCTGYTMIIEAVKNAAARINRNEK